MFKIDVNIISSRWNERMSTLSKEQVEEINTPLGKSQLVKLKKSNGAIKEGDVFVLSPKRGIFFYGKVFEANIEHINMPNSWYTGCHVIFVFKSTTQTIDISNYNADYDKILIGPCIVSSDYWKRGLFENVGNIPITLKEKQMDYGFFSMEPLGRWGTFCHANGKAIQHIPQIFSHYGISTLNGIYDEMRTELIVNPSLLEQTETNVDKTNGGVY